MLSATGTGKTRLTGADTLTGGAAITTMFSGVTTVISGVTNNTDTPNVQAGTLDLAGGGASKANIAIASGATPELGARAHARHLCG